MSFERFCESDNKLCKWAEPSNTNKTKSRARRLRDAGSASLRVIFLRGAQKPATPRLTVDTMMGASGTAARPQCSRVTRTALNTLNLLVTFALCANLGFAGQVTSSGRSFYSSSSSATNWDSNSWPSGGQSSFMKRFSSSMSNELDFGHPPHFPGHPALASHGAGHHGHSPVTKAPVVMSKAASVAPVLLTPPHRYAQDKPMDMMDHHRNFATNLRNNIFSHFHRDPLRPLHFPPPGPLYSGGHRPPVTFDHRHHGHMPPTWTYNVQSSYKVSRDGDGNKHEKRSTRLLGHPEPLVTVDHRPDMRPFFGPFGHSASHQVGHFRPFAALPPLPRHPLPGKFHPPTFPQLPFFQMSPKFPIPRLRPLPIFPNGLANGPSGPVVDSSGSSSHKQAGHGFREVKKFDVPNGSSSTFREHSTKERQNRSDDVRQFAWDDSNPVPVVVQSP